MSDAMKKISRVLQGERAAAETYKQALEKLGDDPRADRLRENQTEHLDAILKLKRHITHEGGEPPMSSGAWGGLAKAVQGTANLFSNKSSLMALKEGEEIGLRQYKDILDDDEINASLRQLIKTEMIPNQEKHIKKIEGVMDALTR